MQLRKSENRTMQLTTLGQGYLLGRVARVGLSSAVNRELPVFDKTHIVMIAIDLLRHCVLRLDAVCHFLGQCVSPLVVLVMVFSNTG
jgi:hypothetical protein